MIVGRNRINQADFCPLLLDKSELEFVSEYKYLGVILNSDKGLSFSATSTVRSFQRAANAILHGRIKPDLHVLMKLLYTNCVQ